ncbi:hypothetical protein Tco_0086469 [Tanacetum coccineum]
MEYAPTTPSQQQPEFPNQTQSRVSSVPERDDPIDAINHHDCHFNAVVTSHQRLLFFVSWPILEGNAQCTHEGTNPGNLNYDYFTQSEQIMTFSEQSNDVSQSETEITSDSHIFYSQYLSEAQQETVQNPNSSAPQDV